MAESGIEFAKESLARARVLVAGSWHMLRRNGPGQIQFWFLALLIGFAAGFAALGFRLAITWLQALFYGTNDVVLASQAHTLSWELVLIIPVLGGLAVGFILHFFTPGGRVRSVADVIEGSALGDGRVESKEGIASAASSLITLSTGGSSGREGPVVHLAGLIATAVSNVIHADGVSARDLLGCAVAAAVSASFNTPIAGALFALEVILRHFAVHAFAPIVIASVAGTIVSRLEFGNITEFYLAAGNRLEFYVELPAFVVLGLVSGLVAVVLMKSVFWADDLGNIVQRNMRIPRWLRPVVAGALLGGLAVIFPHIIGVGYATTSAALSGKLMFWTVVLFALAKGLAVVITLAGRMGGGIFSPSLMMGALTGLAFGQAATGFLPAVSGSETLYALAGMGAVAAAVLGAPISTTLIVFELTGDWQTGLAVMVAVSLSTALASRLVDRSFFLTQLERRNVHLAAGPQAWLLAACRVKTVLRPLGTMGCATEEACRELIEQGIWLDENATLESALPMFEEAAIDDIPVIRDGDGDDPPVLLGSLLHVDALRAYAHALSATALEEHS
ncbi:MAG: chloride channel protein [Paracoccaceae bacterium]